MRPRALVALCLVCLLLAGAGCRPAPRTRLMVRGGPSLEKLFADLAAAYATRRPDVRVDANFLCPPCRIMESPGMPMDFDIFASMGQFELDRLEQFAQFRPAVTRPIGQTKLVIATSRYAQTQVRTVADLHKADFRRMGVGDPEKVGVGHYARAALQRMGLWDELRPRMVTSQSGCELLKWLGLGHQIDAAVVFSLCVSEDPGSVRQVMEFPPEVAPPVPILLAVRPASPHQAEALNFIEFARGATEILARHRIEPMAQTAP